MEHNRSGKGQRINMSGVLIENQAHGGGMPQFLLKISKIAHLHLKCFFFSNDDDDKDNTTYILRQEDYFYKNNNIVL